MHINMSMLLFPLDVFLSFRRIRKVYLGTCGISTMKTQNYSFCIVGIS